jgi:FMN phosphatase YigB (HAD superfamily)
VRLAGLLRRTLLIYSKNVGLKKDSPKIFQHAAKAAGLEGMPGQCLFVGEDATERGHALTAGWCVCPHPLLVGEVLAGRELRYTRVQAPLVEKVNLGLRPSIGSLSCRCMSMEPAAL